MRIYEIEAGRLLWGHIRDYLSEMKFKGHQIDYMESSGWIERKFTVKGPDGSLRIIESELASWAAQNNLSA